MQYVQYMRKYSLLHIINAQNHERSRKSDKEV